jgi:CRP/FNR family cyclic AMP-dependent transcriptional regulator
MQRDFVMSIKQFPLRSFQKGASILQAGQPADTLYAIRNGFAKIDSLSNNGNQQLIWIAGRYDIIPTESLFRKHGELLFYYSALTELEAYEIPKTAFLEMSEQNPLFIKEIAQSMSGHYDDLLVRLRSVEQSTVREKLIYTLHYIGSRFSGDSVVRLSELGLHISHQDIARMIGATRETTAIELKQLKDAGLIDYSRTEFIIYTDKLVTLL